MTLIMSRFLFAGFMILATACSAGTAPQGRLAADVRSTTSESPAQSSAAGPTAYYYSAAVVEARPSETGQAPSATGPQPAMAGPTPLATDDAAGPFASPSPRFSASAAYDGATGDTVLFGGETFANGDFTFLSDTWIWKGRHWTQVTPAHSPSARASAQMAYDPLHRQVVLFGGMAGDRLTDTWLWNGSDWTQAAPAHSPVGTIEEGMTFFSGTRTVLMYSSGDQMVNMGNHVYSWDGSDWTDLPFSGGPPLSAFQGGLSADPVRGVVVLLAFDYNQAALQHWEFDGTTWTHRDVSTPPTRSLVQTLTDERDHTIVLFGGTGVNDTWTWDGTRWTQQHPRHAPSVRSSTGPMPSMAYDAMRGEVVIFGGIEYTTNVPLNDTWTWNGGDWHSR